MEPVNAAIIYCSATGTVHAPYGTSHVASQGRPDKVSLEAARYQARRAVDTAAVLKAGRAA
jgi:hypothetical protein